MKLFLIGFVTLTSGLFLYLFFHLGFAKKVINDGLVEETFYIIGTSHLGPYYKINAVIQDVESWAQRMQISCPFTFGLYLDNPHIADENRLRSEGGCISKQPYPVEVHQQVLNSHYFTRKLEQKKYLKFSFSGSPAISPFKVYPAANDWFNETGYPRGTAVLEIYKMNGNKMTTEYYFPIAQKEKQ